MDPCLEGSRWMGVDSQLVAEIARQLAPKLRPRYVAFMTQRVVVAAPPEVQRADVPATTGVRYPDVAVIDTGAAAGNGGSAATATAAPLRLATVIPEPIPHFTVEIRDTAEQRLVTAIEVLSPTNKRGDGRSEYLRKRRRLLRSQAHLLEIDLVRVGRRYPVARELPPVPYF